MNAQLKKLPDGSGAEKRNEVCWFLMAGAAGRDFGEIYWPFVLHWQDCDEKHYTVTHLPSGYAVVRKLKKPRALKLVADLRALKVDWQFTKPVGRKWLAVKDAAGPIVKAFTVKP